MSQNESKEFLEKRKSYIKDSNENKIPYEGIYYYYLLHFDGEEQLSFNEFVALFNQAIMQSYNEISMQIEDAVMNIEEVLRICDKYYNIQFLEQKDGTFIKLC